MKIKEKENEYFYVYFKGSVKMKYLRYFAFIVLVIVTISCKECPTVDDKTTYLFYFILEDECNLCRGGIVDSTKFSFKFGDTSLYEGEKFARYPFSILFESNKNGGETYQGSLVRICRDPETNKKIKMTCKSNEGRTSNTSGESVKDVYVILKCECEEIKN